MKTLAYILLFLMATSCQITLKNESHSSFMSALINPELPIEVEIPECSPSNSYEIVVDRNNNREIIRLLQVTLLVNGEEIVMDGPANGFGLHTIESCDIPHDGSQRFRYRLTYEKGLGVSPPANIQKAYYPSNSFIQETLVIMAMGITRPIVWDSPDKIFMPDTDTEYNGMSAILRGSLSIIPEETNPLISTFTLNTELPFENTYVYRAHAPGLYYRESGNETSDFIVEPLDSQDFPIVFPYDPDENGQKKIGFKLRYNTAALLPAGDYRIKIVIPLETIISSSVYTIWADISIQ